MKISTPYFDILHPRALSIRSLRFHSEEAFSADIWFNESTYKCPSCEGKFSKLSALYQHAEDVPPCASPINGHGCLAKLERFIVRSL